MAVPKKDRIEELVDPQLLPLLGKVAQPITIIG